MVEENIYSLSFELNTETEVNPFIYFMIFYLFYFINFFLFYSPFIYIYSFIFFLRTRPQIFLAYLLIFVERLKHQGTHLLTYEST